MDDSIRDSEILKKHMTSIHEKNRREYKAEVLAKPGHYIRHTRSETYDTKTSRPHVSLNKLIPVHCQSLAPNTVHVGRVLRGVLVVDPCVVNSAHSIIEDEAGGLVNVSFYNFAPDELGLAQLTNIAESLFPSGKKVAIVEPFYKDAQDGTQIVRVENFAKDVIFLDHLGPSNFEGWRVEGKVHVDNQQFREAIFCLSRSIGTHDKSKLAAVLLSNIATCLLKKGLYSTSLLLAVASFTVDNSFFRPFYTAGFCLNSLNRKDLAFNCLEQCRMLNASSALCVQLEEILGENTTEHIPASTWNARVLCLVASENVQDLLQINSNDVVDSETLKEKGNELFKKQQYDEAIKEYCIALRGISKLASRLNNVSLCHAKIGNHAEVALYASAAILVAPNNAKAHYWKSLSLLQLDQKEGAGTSCDAALEIVSGDRDLKQLRERIRSACMASSVSESKEKAMEGPHLRDQEGVTERRREEELRKHNMPTESVSIMNNKLLEMISGMMGISHKVDDRVAPFHLEFSRKGEWPVECDTHLGMELLTRAYENARAPDPLRDMNLERPSAADMAMLWKRLNSNDEQVLKWWLKAPFESISPRKRNSYASKMHHSFTNSQCRAKEMLSGTVHVSVGFVDLSELLFFTFMSVGQSGPARWIGYEASAYSVAKSMVLAHMLRHQADTDCILQVWYSSSWSKKTLRSFRKALNEILNRTKAAGATIYSAEVVSLLHHWQQFDVTLKTAHSQWLARHNLCNQVEIANFRRKMDRFAVCRYIVSGEVLKGEVGSVVMFGLPSTKDGDEYQIALNEWFLHCLPNYILAEELDTKTTYIDAAINILRKRVSELKKLVSGGDVVIEIQHKIVKLSEERVIREIRKLSPQAMSWSNLCDYYSNEEFHKMTLACSGSDTTHYVSSMNWCTEVKGTFMMDILIDSQKEILEGANVLIAAQYQRSGLIDYFHAPPITHHYNIGAYHLCFMTKKTWTENFFDAAALKGTEKQAVIESVKFDVFARTSNTIHMKYKFNKDKQRTALNA